VRPPGSFGRDCRSALRPAEVLEARKHAFDQIELAIDGLTVGYRLTAAHDRWNDGFGASLGEKLAQAVGVVSLVSDQALDRPGSGDQSGGKGDIVDVAGREKQHARPALGIWQGMDFPGSPAARTPDGFLESPLFAGCRTACPPA